MMRNIIQVTIAVFIMVSFFSILALTVGCGGNKPDLIPQRRPGSEGKEGYCNIKEGKFIVIVKNQGGKTLTPDVEVTVEFMPGGVFVKPMEGIPALLPAGGTVEIPFDIPVGGIEVFKITVDSNNKLEESNENNNTADGRCIN